MGNVSVQPVSDPEPESVPPAGREPGNDRAVEADPAPLVYFGARRPWALVDVRELWQFRGLLWALAERDIKVKYRQTLVGIAWAVLQPLATSLVFVLLFGLLGRVPAAGDVPYGLVVLSGVVIWQLFATTLAQATTSLVLNQNLIGKVFFPRLVLPLATAVPALVDFAVGLVVLAGVMAYYGIAPPWQVVFLPGFVLLALLTALAAGVWTAALNAIYRDVGYVIPFVLQVGFFVTPVVYATDVLIPERWRPLLALNPMTGVLDGFRWALLGRDDFPAVTLLTSAAVLAAVLAGGLMYFRRVEGYVADRI